MQKVILTKGLPGSGKSTWAKELMKKEPGRWKRINKDDLRAMLDDGKWSNSNEKFVLAIRDNILARAMLEGWNVIIDDTNLAPKHEEHIRQLVAARNKAEKLNGTKIQHSFEIKDFTNVSLEECIKRDQKRPNYVGEKVIKQMYNQFLRPKPEIIDHDARLPWAVICDLDGTLALFGDNNPYNRDFSRDTVNEPIKDLFLSYGEDGRKKLRRIILSGRDGSHREQTEQWLADNKIPYDELHMREANDNRKDYVIKRELYEAHIKGRFNVCFVLDDRDHVVELWRSLGLTCLQVADGDF